MGNNNKNNYPTTVQIMSHLLKLFLLVLSGQCIAGTLTYTEVSANEYELTLQNEVPLEIEQAQQSVSGAGKPSAFIFVQSI